MKSETKWAAIMSIALFAWMSIEKMLGLHEASNFYTWIIVDSVFCLVLFTLSYFNAMREKRDGELRGVMTYAEGFWTGAIMTLIFVPLSTLLIYVLGRYISPVFPEVFAEKACPTMSDHDPLSTFLFLHVVLSIIFGLLFSSVIPYGTKKDFNRGNQS